MTEHELTGEVMKLCDELGLLYHHCLLSTHCQGPKGFPDLLVAGGHGLIIAELKSEDGDNSAEQDLWAWTLRRSGIERNVIGPPALWISYEHWRPFDLKSGLIRSVLEAIK